MVTPSMTLPSKAGLKNSKHGPNDRGSNVGKPMSQVCVFCFFVNCGRGATSGENGPVF